MFNLSGTEIVFLLIAALVVLGPDKLPDALRKAGRAYGEFKKVSQGFQSEFRSAFEEPMNEVRSTADMVRQAARIPDDEPSVRVPAPDQPPSTSVPDTEPVPVDPVIAAEHATDDEADTA